MAAGNFCLQPFAGLSAFPATVSAAVQKLGQENHAKLLAKICRGDFICEKLDNIRFRAQVDRYRPA